MSIYKELREVQQKLKAPKGQKNTFGNYNYRSAEDILEAVKPLLHGAGLTMIVSDELINQGDRYYVKASATIFNDQGETLVATGLAREAFDKKGMDDAQITGSASSYARKYALNGLFNIDDTKDADTNEYTNNAPKMTPKERADSRQEVWDAGSLPRAKKKINEMLTDKGYDTAIAKLTFVKSVLSKETIDTEEDCNLVADAIDNE